MTTREIDTPQLRATQLTARPGTLPTLTVPMNGRSAVDVDHIWRHLAEPADFFGVQMPGRADLSAAITAFVTAFPEGADPALVAMTMTIAENDEAPQILVTGSTRQPLIDQAVHVAGELGVAPLHRASDPWWQRMAARTTSRAASDRCERWLEDRGFADALSEGQPLVGALVCEVNGRLVGVENPEPTSLLDQLTECGVISALDRVAQCPPDAVRAWWVSPRYETHPVAQLSGSPIAVDPGLVPAFARWT